MSKTHWTESRVCLTLSGEVKIETMLLAVSITNFTWLSLAWADFNIV
jgi:hypothetical protein